MCAPGPGLRVKLLPLFSFVLQRPVDQGISLQAHLSMGQVLCDIVKSRSDQPWTGRTLCHVSSSSGPQWYRCAARAKAQEGPGWLLAQIRDEPFFVVEAHNRHHRWCTRNRTCVCICRWRIRWQRRRHRCVFGAASSLPRAGQALSGTEISGLRVCSAFAGTFSPGVIVGTVADAPKPGATSPTTSVCKALFRGLSPTLVASMACKSTLFQRFPKAPRPLWLGN